MSFIITLWLPILVSAVFVFIVSSVIHMFLGYHRNDYKAVPNEDKAQDSLRDLGLAPGEYVIPKPLNSAHMRSDEYRAKVEKGPVVTLTVRASNWSMSSSMVQWFLYCVLVSIFAGYIGYNAIGEGGDYLEVFRFVGCSAFMGYAMALLQGPIWWDKNWAATLRSVFDGLVYGLVTAGTFGWLWPA